jgi:hypothetical protein
MNQAELTHYHRCPVCGKTFKTQNGLAEHEKTSREVESAGRQTRPGQESQPGQVAQAREPNRSKANWRRIHY